MKNPFSLGQHEEPEFQLRRRRVIERRRRPRIAVVMGIETGDIRMFLGFVLARQPPVGQGLLIHEVSRSHTKRCTTDGKTLLDE